MSSVTKEEMRLLVSERKHSGWDIVYRCFALAFNCKCLSFARTELNLGKHGYEVDVSAIIAATDPGKCDGPFTGVSRKGIGLQPSTTRSTSKPGMVNRTWTMNSVDVSLDLPWWTA